MSPLYHGQSGSTGTEEFERVSLAITRFLALSSGNQTSQAWSSIWDNRATLFRGDNLEIKYVVGGGESNTPAGWLQYYKRLLGSTRNTSSGGQYNILGLPDELWRDFTTRAPVTGETTGDDSERGDHVFEILMTTGFNLDGPTNVQTDLPYQTGDGRGLLAAWAAVGNTSAVPSS